MIKIVKQNLHTGFSVKIIVSILLILIGTYLVSPCCAQDSNTYVSALDQYGLAKAASAEGDFEKALQILDQIDDQDSIYLSARVLEVEIRYGNGEYNAVIGLCEKHVRDNSIYNYEFLLNQGNALLSLGRSEEGVELLEEMISLYPKSNLAWYNTGVGLIQLGKYEEAIKALKQSILCNAYYPSPHWQLGNLFLEEGLVSQAILCYNTYLLLNPSRSNSREILGKMDRALRSKLEPNKRGISITKNDAAFYELDLIMQNFIGLNDDYLVSTPLDLPFVKQQQCLMESLEKFRENDGFFGQYYVPFYREMMRQGYFDSFIYRILSSNGNESHMAIIDKHYKNGDEFVNWIASAWKGLLSLRLSPEGDSIFSDFRGSGEIESEWNFEKGKSGRREYHYYHKHGNISTTGDRINDSRDGLWLWWDETGISNEKTYYRQGEADGSHCTFYDNGNLKKSAFLESGGYHGEMLEYSRYGVLTARSCYSNNQKTDTSFIYYPYGEPFLKYTIPYKEDKIDGTVHEYHPGGELKMLLKFEDGIRTGKEVHYHINGSISDYYFYEDDMLSGISESFYPDSTLKSTRLYKANNAIGIWKSFRPDGSLESSSSYSNNGELHGEYQEYGRKGEVLVKHMYETGKLISQVYYNESGERISESKLDEEGLLEYIFFTPSGVLKTHGQYDSNGEKTGTWIYNNQYGDLISKEFYRDGNIHGVDEQYYPGGPIESEYEYKNGLADGSAKFYYPDGTLSSESWIVGGLTEGRYKEYYTDGALSKSSYYQHDEKEGVEEEYSADQKITSRAIFDKGMLLEAIYYDSAGLPIDTFRYFEDSVRVERYQNGEIRYREHYKNGYSHGVVERFYFNGKPRLKGSMFMGKRHGIWEWYGEKGFLSQRGEYSYGTRKGKWIDYYEDGKVSMERYLKEGELHGPFISYSESGAVDAKRNYVHGDKNGEAFYYSEAGELQMVRVYEYGRLKGYSYPGSDGKLVSVIPIINGTADVVCHYANGQISRKYGLLSGEFHGLYEKYYSDGTLHTRDTYQYGNNTGPHTEFYPNGKVKNKAFYLNDEFHGPMESFYENGSRKSSYLYKNGVVVGTAYFYRKDGSLEKTREYFNDEIIYETIH